MAERVLPSCQEMMDDRPWIGDELEVVIVEAYAEGRLVDREAIDYEAAHLVHRSQNTKDAALDPPGHYTEAILDAALGEV